MIELTDPRWTRDCASCPPEKRAWLTAQGGEHSATFADPRLADAARLAMLQVYGLEDLYYEGPPQPDLEMNWETLTMQPIDNQPV